MSKHDEARRAFLIGAAVGAVAGAGLVPDALAQDHKRHAAANAPASAHPHSTGAGHGAFLNDDDAAIVAAFTERLMPGPPRRRSSTRCARTRWKACSPTRSTAATRTSQAGAW